MVIGRYLSWCCDYMNTYPDMIPYARWGRFQTLPYVNHNKKEQKEWEERNCNLLVGGEHKDKCEGMLYYQDHTTY